MYMCFVTGTVICSVLCSYWHNALFSFGCKVLPCYKE